jgi:tRNA nucleotidyltransferase/poly(A) polymerase
MTADQQRARDFAVDVVRRLRASGHQALWAGGCVRDELMGEIPKDYDVATDAVPDRVREVFGHRRTLPIGASFGVITVLGPPGAGQIDVATFRRDAAYSDGRHPDAVSYSDAEHDAQRRDFTINGLFFDPLENRVIDYVGGQADLSQGVIRAIGDPLARIAEDKLRMLRAVRFAARFNFEIDPGTLTAIKQQARELVIVSAERIAAELRLILTHPTRARGVELLAETGLLEVVLPEAAVLQPDVSPPAWTCTLGILRRLSEPTFAMALAGLLRMIDALQHKGIARRVFERWKLSTHELETVERLIHEELPIRQAQLLPWPQLQRMLTAPGANELLAYCEAVALECGDGLDALTYCRHKLALPVDLLNPRPFVNGDDLRAMGIPPGPAYRDLLNAVRDAQLEGRITSRDEAIRLVDRLHPPSSK